MNRALVAITCLAVTVSAQADDDIGNRVLAALEPHVAHSMTANRTPGLALALTGRDGVVVVHNWGVADLKTGAPVTDDTLFQIGSVTKSFTALALLNAAEAGKLDLDKPVSDALPWFSVHSEFAPITPSHLLSHTAGIPANRDDIYSSPYMAAALVQQRTAWAPGTNFHYSNIGYQTLHVLLETATGRDYADILRDDFFDPLGMQHSEPAIRLESRSRQAVGYVAPYDDRPTDPSRELVEAQFDEYAFGDGCIQSTASDLAAYTRLWLNRGAMPDGRRVVSETAFREFATIRPGAESVRDRGMGSPRRGYGYGVDIAEFDDGMILSHTGGMVGFLAFAGADLRKGHGVAVLVNGPGEPLRIGRLALEIWAAIEAGEPLPAAPADDANPVNAAEFVGHYESASGPPVEIRATDGEVVLVRDGKPAVLASRGEDAFYSTAPELERYFVAFGRNDDGRVVEFVHGADWYTSKAYRGPREFNVPAEWAAFTGRYRNFSPWHPYFEVITRKGELLVITGEGGETASGSTRLVPLGEGRFRIGEDVTPEILAFHDLVDGQALRATWSGHVFYRQ